MLTQPLAMHAAIGRPTTDGGTVAGIDSERRTVGQALSWWHEVRGERRLPLLADVDLTHGPLGPTLFLLDLGDDPAQAVFRHCGGSLSTAFGRRLNGRRPHEALPPDMADHLLDLVVTVVRYRRPLADAATRPRVRGGGLLRHRMAVMPVAADADGLRVSHVVGAFSYRIDLGA
ncbi:PAS domain-containing protein [Caenispirillum bisanense]|uniref:PAS domain-containing protein n=1 Tax=Caenispirillum bisanense TaxID=414052 RepID=UPI0031E0534E